MGRQDNGNFLRFSFFNSLPNEKISNWSKLKAFADDKIIMTEILIFLLLRMVENTVGKGENAGYQHFLLFPQCFQKASFFFLKLCGEKPFASFSIFPRDSSK